MATKRKTRRKAQDLSWSPKRPFTERDGGKVLTPEEVADVLGTKVRHVWDMMNRGDLPKLKIGGKVRVHIEDVEAYIESRRVSPER